jgi:hypothetical protein
MQASVLLGALAFAVPALAQTEAQPKPPAAATEKLWKIEATGLGG